MKHNVLHTKIMTKKLCSKEAAIYILRNFLVIELGESTQECPVCTLTRENKASGVHREEYRAQEICREALSGPQLNTGHHG